MNKNRGRVGRLVQFWLAAVMMANVFLALPAAAFAQGETPRCPDAPLRVPSGDQVGVAYFNDPSGSYWGVGFQKQGVNVENVIPVYAPISGTLEVNQAYGFPGGVFITGTLDATWEGRVPTRFIRIWMTHMANSDGSQNYVVRQPGPVNEGDLIGYQGTDIDRVRLYVGIYDKFDPFTYSNWTTIPQGHREPRPYFNAYVDGAEVISRGLDDDGRDYPVYCKETPVGRIEYPYWNGFVRGTTQISGFALDRTNVTQTIGINGGVDQVKVFLDGYDPSQGGSGTLIGTVSVNIARPDVAAVYGAQVTNSGWSLNWDTSSVPAGRHSLHMYAHQVSSNKWLLMDVRYVNTTPFFMNWLPFIRR